MRFNIRGLMSTNIEVDRRLFNWDGSNHADLFPKSPACIAVETPGTFVYKVCLITKKNFLVIKRLNCDPVAALFPLLLDNHPSPVFFVHVLTKFR